MTSAPRRLQDALAESAAGSALMHRYRASQRAAAVIESECQRIVPEFQPARSGGCDLRGTTLRLNAWQPAQVAKLRQAVPRLLRLLQEQGFDVIEIKIRVQPRALSSSVRWPPILTMPRARQAPGADRAVSSQIKPALTFARKLALTLPESRLRAAAQRLAATLTATIAQIRESGEPRNEQNGEEQNT